VTAAIRPEDIDAEAISEGGDNVVEVEIAAMEFLGSYYRVALGGAAVGEQGIRADLSINLVRRKNLEVGSKIPVRFPAQFIRIYPGD
jgi:iron(III) transport system ATP-binding protein